MKKKMTMKELKTQNEVLRVQNEARGMRRACDMPFRKPKLTVNWAPIVMCVTGFLFLVACGIIIFGSAIDYDSCPFDWDNHTRAPCRMMWESAGWLWYPTFVNSAGVVCLLVGVVVSIALVTVGFSERDKWVTVECEEPKGLNW